MPPIIPNLLTTRNTIQVESARLYEPPDHYVDDEIGDYYNTVHENEETVDSSDITPVSETENYRNEDRAQLSVPNIADISPIPNQPASVCLLSPSTPEMRLRWPPAKGSRTMPEVVLNTATETPPVNIPEI